MGLFSPDPPHPISIRPEREIRMKDKKDIDGLCHIIIESYFRSIDGKIMVSGVL